MSKKQAIEVDAGVNPLIGYGNRTWSCPSCAVSANTTTLGPSSCAYCGRAVILIDPKPPIGFVSGRVKDRQR